MSRRVKSGFTLIELLVVIAIIAILAAILFPVFAQARAKARQATCISNTKQLALATLMYVQDYDESYPMAFGYYPGLGWLWNYYGNVPWNSNCTNGACGPAWTSGMSGYWQNSIQPYSKNYQVEYCLGSAKDVPVYGQAAGAPAIQKVTYTYNGLLQSSSQAIVNVPAQLPMITEGQGAAALGGAGLNSPVLICDTSTDLTCQYKPAGGSGNGSSSLAWGFQATAAVHGNGQTYAYVDGHAKYKGLSLSAQSFAAHTSWTNEPWAYYNAGGFPVSYWTDGYHVWYFRPDYNFQ
jgi:prepilin-type N-terminal cleavage/methylation domain-containing protein